LIEEKYSEYVNCSKSVNEPQGKFKKPIYAYIICIDKVPIGYIQYYNLYDFPRESCTNLSDLPKSCASFDWYIGEVEFIGKNIGSKALSLFLEEHVFQRFDYVFVDPDITNLGAIRAYEKVGFRKAKEQGGIGELWMIREK
jgi:aminoglycoside 6'-N-acetyltransferase